ncbi:unnamed protein product [Brugia pahangi]|uniref:Uncharacterized protein n=1 Tax=Brugia pahangi TaxID=6280 RepID=A0A0N4TCA7_BRUPA|nr:unnamed protein product [Brugia pahangi]
MKNMKTKPKDDTYVEDMTNAFAIILPEYMIRCTDECDTVFEKIEDIMRPKNFPHSNYNRNDDVSFIFYSQNSIKLLNLSFFFSF